MFKILVSDNKLLNFSFFLLVDNIFYFFSFKENELKKSQSNLYPIFNFANVFLTLTSFLNTIILSADVIRFKHFIINSLIFYTYSTHTLKHIFIYGCSNIKPFFQLLFLIKPMLIFLQLIDLHQLFFYYCHIFSIHISNYIHFRYMNLSTVLLFLENLFGYFFLSLLLLVCEIFLLNFEFF